MDDSFAVHHVGYAVRDIETTAEVFATLFGYSRAHRSIEVPSEQVRVCFLETGHGFWIELVEPLSPSSPVSRLTERSGASPYHICYEVKDLEPAIAAFRKKGCRVLRRFSVDLDGEQRFAYLMARDGQLVELGQISLADGHPLKRAPASSPAS